MKASEALELAKKFSDITDVLELIKYHATKGSLSFTTEKLLSPFQVKAIENLGYTVRLAHDPMLTAFVGRGPEADRNTVSWGQPTDINN